MTQVVRCGGFCAQPWLEVQQATTKVWLVRRDFVPKKSADREIASSKVLVVECCVEGEERHLIEAYSSEAVMSRTHKSMEFSKKRKRLERFRDGSAVNTWKHRHDTHNMKKESTQTSHINGNIHASDTVVVHAKWPEEQSLEKRMQECMHVVTSQLIQCRTPLCSKNRAGACEQQKRFTDQPIHIPLQCSTTSPTQLIRN